MTEIVKLSGHEIDDAAFLARFAQAAAQRAPLIVVHGGGKEISAMQARFGLETRTHQGVRITDGETLEVVRMVLCGAINKRLVRALQETGVDAVGLSGVDGRLLEAEPMKVEGLDMGFTGTPTCARAELLRALLAQGFSPVIAPIAYGQASDLNINADHAAGALAAALPAERLVFLSNVDGVLRGGHVVRHLSAAQAEAWIADGTISGGMIPKVRTALGALHSGVAQVSIASLDSWQNDSATIFNE
ncbi:MAG: acetylglutamate kinase [Anaerolineae bacterium]|nr:acetylglutamate kinase [Anaerolineae bacterium]MDW8173099.1 acetylglutamate kinase [Anaerolineae bacterium]